MRKNNLLSLVILVVLIVAVACFAACNKVQDILTEAPDDIYYDGQYLTWDKVDADYYTVSINGGEAQRVNSATYEYASSENDFEVTISAVKGESSKSVSKTFHLLPTIEQLFAHNDGIVWWDAVAGANAYEVKVNGQTVGQVSDTSYDALSAGTSRVKVRPIVSGDDSFYSMWSAEKRVNIYDTPYNIDYDGTTISWQGNASSYELKINGKASIVTATRFDYNSENRNFDISVKAIGDYIYNYDSEVAMESFRYIDPVTDITVEDGILKWQSVEDAQGYKVRVGANVYTVTDGTEYNGLITGQSLEVSIMPYNNAGSYFSSWSDSMNVYILATPATRWNAELDLDVEANNNFTWDAVLSAAGYTVQLTKPDGTKQIETFSGNSRAFAEFYEDVGVYTVQVKANAPADNADYYDSKYSEPIIVERLAAPKQPMQNFVVSDANNLSQGFTVNFVPVNSATGYQLWKDGARLSGKTASAGGSAIRENNVADNTVTTEQHYTYIVQSLGGVKTLGGRTVVTLNSIKARSLSFDITVLAMPTGLTMSGFNAQWNAVGGSNGYSVAYSGNTFTSSGEIYSLETLNTGTFNVSVAARGDGNMVLASNYTAALEIRRLDYPRNIRITYGGGNGLLEHDDVSNAFNGYSVYIGGNNQALDEQSWDDMYSFISEIGTVLSMTANANKYNDDGTVYYMTSPASPTQQFIRLAAPTFPEGALSTQTEIRWNAPDNVNLREYTPTYVLAYSDTTVAARNGTSYNISELDAGLYVFTVRAVGDDVHFLDSEYSFVSKRCLKLETPAMTVEKDGYHWDAISHEATAYYLEIDGVRVNDVGHQAGKEFIFKPSFTTVGSHKVVLTAVGNGIDTVSSKPFIYEQKVEQLQRPLIDVAYSADHFVAGGTINVTLKEPLPANAESYQFEIGGRSTTSKSLTISQTMDSPGTFTIKVKALGGVIDDADMYYIDSLYSKEESMTLLAAPTKAGFEMTSGGYIQWKVVSGAFGYDYYIIADGEAIVGTADSPIVGQSSVKVADFRKYKTITITVRASGNGQNVINSEWVSWTWTNSQVQA